MTAWERARQWQENHCMTPFEAVLGTHFQSGLIHSTPAIFLCARQVTWCPTSKAFLQGESPNAWFVELAAATPGTPHPVAEFLRVATRPLPYVLWHRAQTGRQHNLHAYTWKNLARRVATPTHPTTK